MRLEEGLLVLGYVDLAPFFLFPVARLMGFGGAKGTSVVGTSLVRGLVIFVSLWDFFTDRVMVGLRSMEFAIFIWIPV